MLIYDVLDDLTARVKALGLGQSSEHPADVCADVVRALNLLRDSRLLLEEAWGVIANTGGGDWSIQPTLWWEAATRWRSKYHHSLDEFRQEATR